MRTFLLGFDSFDPAVFERLSARGQMPNLSRYLEHGAYARLQVSDPPQTEVSWTSIATGLDPGGHGIFDFVHRDPASYIPYVSLLPTQNSRVGTQFVPPHQAPTLFEAAIEMGYPATSLWWPATFPARPERAVRTLPGLGTPDILGRLGVGTLYTTTVQNGDGSHTARGAKTPHLPLRPAGQNRFSADLQGPHSGKGDRPQPVTVEMQLELNGDGQAQLRLGKQVIPLALGQWSPVFEVPFKMGLFFTVKAVTRAILTQVHPEVRLYLLPLQIHPLGSPWRYATPPGFVKEAWKTAGPFLTLGWPQDTTGLEEDCISDAQFLDLCESICAGRERLVYHLLDSFNEGVMAAVFDSLDRVQHMFWRHPEVVESWYLRLDRMVGEIEKRLQKSGKEPAKLLVLSDHGFTGFDHKVHLNRWLAESGFLNARSPLAEGGLDDVDWSRSDAYAVGLNSIYLNRAGREGQGRVTPEAAGPVAALLRERLLEWRGSDGRPVIQRVLLNEEAFAGPLADRGPDLLIGYAPGYRASPETGLGKWKPVNLEPNNDHWNGDHCIDSEAVPGVLFCNQGLEGLSAPSYRDIPRLAIGKQLAPSNRKPPAPPSALSEAEKENLEERLKSLGYL